MAAHFLKNKFLQYRNKSRAEDKTIYVTIIGKGDDDDKDWRVD